MDGLSIVGAAYAEQATAVRSGETRTGRATDVAAATEKEVQQESKPAGTYDSSGRSEKPSPPPGQRVNTSA